VNSGLCDDQRRSLRFVYKAVFAFDSLGPPSGEFVSEGFGFANPPKRIAQSFFYHPQQTLGDIVLMLNPILQILKRLRDKFQAHVPSLLGIQRRGALRQVSPAPPSTLLYFSALPAIDP